MIEQTLVLRGRLGVAPEFGRAQHRALFIEQHQAMLLAGHADAENLLAADARSRQRLSGRLLESLLPLLRLLLAAAIGAALQRVAGAAGAEHLAAACVQHQRLGALGAAVDTEVHGSVAQQGLQGTGHAELAQAVVTELEGCDEGF